MKTIRDFEVKNKRVLVRCDFNVPLDENGNIRDDFRIKATLPTINYLLENKARVILMSHLGKPNGEIVEKLKMDKVAYNLSGYLGFAAIKADDCIGDKVQELTNSLNSGQILLLENLRFHKEEEENNTEFAKELSQLGEIYINDAFGASHRAHASIVRIPEFLPSGAGFLLEKEVKILSSVIENPKRILVALIGGAKISSKSKVIEKFLEIADHLLLGGEIANVILRAKGYSIGKPSGIEEGAESIKNINLTSIKLHLPVDVVSSLDLKGNSGLKILAPANINNQEFVLDIGPETVNIFSKIIKEAKMIVWAGPLGLFEEKNFQKGTEMIARAITQNQDAFKIAGGGDTITALNKFGAAGKFDHISTGGGAMLAFLGDEEMPGLKALK